MKTTALRVALVLLLAVQGWRAVGWTRYDVAFERGVTAYRAGDAATARAAFAAAQAVRPERYWVRVWRGDAALYEHDNPTSEPADPKHQAELLEEAWNGYAGAVSRCPTDAWSWSGLSEVALRRVRLRERTAGFDIGSLSRFADGVWDPGRAVALAAGTIATELKPSGFQGLDALAEVWASTGDDHRASDLLARSARMMPVPSSHSWGTGRRLGASELRGVMAALEAGVAAAPEFERCRLYIEIGQFAAAQSDYDAAMSELDRATSFVKNDYERFRLATERARVLETTGRFTEAIAALESLRETSYADRIPRKILGNLRLRVGQPDLACADLAEALRGSPQDDALRTRASEACEQAGDESQAERLLRERILSPPDDLEFARSLLEFYRRTGRLHTAAMLARRWARDYPSSDVLKRWADEYGEAVNGS